MATTFFDLLASHDDMIPTGIVRYKGTGEFDEDGVESVKLQQVYKGVTTGAKQWRDVTVVSADATDSFFEKDIIQVCQIEEKA